MKYDRKNYDIDKICPLSGDYKVIKLVKPGSTILEIGCATGYIGKFLKERMNCKLFGIEIDEKAAKIAEPYYEEIIIGDVEDENLLKDINIKFDYILCMSVLEHLKDPKKILIRLKQFIKENGRVIIIIPNVAYWAIRLKLLFGNFDYEKGILGGYGKGIMDETHLRFFTYKTAKKLINDAGYKVVYSSFDPDMGLPKFHGLLLRIPYGWKLLEKFYSINPKIFAFNFIFEIIRS